MGGALGLSEDEIWLTSPRVLVWMYQGMTEKIELQSQTLWEAIRFNSLVTANSQGAKIKDPKKLIKFPWEIDKKTGVSLTKDDIKRLKEKFNGIK